MYEASDRRVFKLAAFRFTFAKRHVFEKKTFKTDARRIRSLSSCVHAKKICIVSGNFEASDRETAGLQEKPMVDLRSFGTLAGSSWIALKSAISFASADSSS